MTVKTGGGLRWLLLGHRISSGNLRAEEPAAENSRLERLTTAHHLDSYLFSMLVFKWKN